MRYRNSALGITAVLLAMFGGACAGDEPASPSPSRTPLSTSDKAEPNSTRDELQQGMEDRARDISIHGSGAYDVGQAMFIEVDQEADGILPGTVWSLELVPRPNPPSQAELTYDALALGAEAISPFRDQLDFVSTFVISIHGSSPKTIAISPKSLDRYLNYRGEYIFTFAEDVVITKV